MFAHHKALRSMRRPRRRSSCSGVQRGQELAHPSLQLHHWLHWLHHWRSQDQAQRGSSCLNLPLVVSDACMCVCVCVLREGKNGLHTVTVPGLICIQHLAAAMQHSKHSTHVCSLAEHTREAPRAPACRDHTKTEPLQRHGNACTRKCWVFECQLLHRHRTLKTARVQR